MWRCLGRIDLHIMRNISLILILIVLGFLFHTITEMNSNQCIFIRANGNRCTRPLKMGNHRCFQHPVGTEERREQKKAERKIAAESLHGPICEGMDNAGLKCITPKLHNSDYCCTPHDPLIATASAIAKYRKRNLHLSSRDVVLEYRGNKDIYKGKSYTKPINPDKDEQDHVVELHTVRDCRDSIKKFGTGFGQKMKVFDINLRDNIVNEKENLGFTNKLVNAEKFRAVFNFAEDYKRSCVAEEQGLVNYLDKREEVSSNK
jgi:hypothetical protein